MRTLNAMIYRGLQFIITGLIAVMIVPVTLQIASRFIEFVPRYIWTEEVARFCLMWLIMLGATIAVRDGTHFDVDVLPAPKPARGNTARRLDRYGRERPSSRVGTSNSVALSFW